jgi:hypothetical protein
MCSARRDYLNIRQKRRFTIKDDFIFRLLDKWRKNLGWADEFCGDCGGKNYFYLLDGEFFYVI